MDERNNISSTLKSNTPNELVVFYAASLQNEIRFYINDDLYFSAIDTDEGCLIMLDEEIDEEEENEEDTSKINISMIIKFLKKFIKRFSLYVGVLILFFIGALYLSKILNNILFFLIFLNIIIFVVNITFIVIAESHEVTPEIKSKHSAEHMMVNFLETNKRLPRNFEEVKKSSRFSSDCGSIELIEGVSEELVQNIVAIVITGFINSIVSRSSSSFTTIVITFLLIYYFVKFIVGKLIELGAFNFIIKPIKKVLNNIVQCFNTTSKVKDNDIMLAYCAAKEWLQVAYPEFYDKNDDLFWNKYIKYED